MRVRDARAKQPVAADLPASGLCQKPRSAGQDPGEGARVSGTLLAASSSDRLDSSVSTRSPRRCASASDIGPVKLVSAPAIAASSDESRAGMAWRTAPACTRARIYCPTLIPRASS